jgi:hypothetical protein
VVTTATADVAVKSVGVEIDRAEEEVEEGVTKRVEVLSC